MRCMKALLITGLVLGLALPAGAISFSQPWNGPIVMHLTNWDMGTIWTGPAGTYLNVNVGPLPPGLVRTASPGSLPGEDGWGVFRVDQILAGKVVGPNNIDALATILWSNGDGGRELVGMFAGLTDVNVIINPDGSFRVQSVGMVYEFWDQPFASFNDGAPGSAGRGGLLTYASVGTPGGVAGAVLWIGGTSSPGFLGNVGGAPPDIEFDSTFNPNAVPPFGAGTAYVFYDVLYGASGVALDTNFFVGASSVGPETADMSLQITTTVNNSPIPAFDWTALSSDPLDTFFVPEPVTMAGMLLGVGCLGRYIRKRR